MADRHEEVELESVMGRWGPPYRGPIRDRPLPADWCILIGRATLTNHSWTD
ncbi:hypothetical protein NQZ68_031195 [Dissostichus eleginoides]|nr:hypothetical protein NQZ68_031195 [Dissostichus eleginoides]